MKRVVIKYRGEYLDEVLVEAGTDEEAVELARERVKELLNVGVRIVLEYDGELLDEPKTEIDLDWLADKVIDEEFEFEVEEEQTL